MRQIAAGVLVRQIAAGVVVRQIAAAAVVAAALVPSTARADWGWGQRYAHAAHAAKVQSRGESPVDCRSCHQLAPGSYQPLPPGRDDHHPCVDCHGGAEFARGPRCLTCHTSIRTMKPGKPWFPPFRTPSTGGEFHVAFSHEKHVAMAKDGDCGGCHSQSGGARASGHAGCARCHATGTLPDMNFCGGCHKPGPAPSVESAVEAPSAFRTSFSHSAHVAAASSHNVRVACDACHAGLAAVEHPGRPAMAACERCHDGARAFDARGTHCGRCHRASAAALQPTTTEEPPFSHAAHRARGVPVESCGSCHAAGHDWRASLAGRHDHRPCANDACHAAEFGKIGSRLCLSCHERNDPFEPNPLKRPSERAQPEWRVAMPHAKHLPLPGQSCLGCHARVVGERAPDGHALCARCHDKTAPAMSQCRGCHAPSSEQPARPWSVAARFRHDQNHRTPCESCHRQPTAPDLSRPTMDGCGRCHDGARAFKVTGFGCVRCHGPRGGAS